MYIKRDTCIYISFTCLLCANMHVSSRVFPWICQFIHAPAYTNNTLSKLVNNMSQVDTSLDPFLGPCLARVRNSRKTNRSPLQWSLPLACHDTYFVKAVHCRYQRSGHANERKQITCWE